jgi:hypothetical protein
MKYRDGLSKNPYMAGEKMGLHLRKVSADLDNCPNIRGADKMTKINFFNLKL